MPGASVEPGLRAWDLGAWTGRPWQELDLGAWRTDPSYDAHGGESLTALLDRVGALLDRWHPRTGRVETGRVAAVTHAAVVKAAVVRALGAPAEAMWGLDVAPGSRTELHTTASGWRVTRVGCR